MSSEVDSGKRTFTVVLEAPVYGAQWNADETRVLSWSEDGTARVWDAAAGYEPVRRGA